MPVSPQLLQSLSLLWWRKAALVLGIGVLIAAGLVFFMTAQPSTAPALSFTSTHGEKFSLQDLRGKVVIVNFWATDCTICMHEMPQMIATYQRYHAQGLEYVAIAMPYDPPNLVLDYATTRRLPFKVVLDLQGDAVKGFGSAVKVIAQTPTTFVLDKHGRIVRRYVGAPDFAELHRLIEGQLAA